MDDNKKAQLEEHGWVFGTVEEFLDLSPEESEYIEFKLLLSQAVRKHRLEHQLTQIAFAERIGSSQSRVAKMENGDPSVSADLLIKSLFALDVKRNDIAELLVSDYGS